MAGRAATIGLYSWEQNLNYKLLLLNYIIIIIIIINLNLFHKCQKMKTRRHQEVEFFDQNLTDFGRSAAKMLA